MQASRPFRVRLDAVIVAVTGEVPRLLTIAEPGGEDRLPSGPLDDRDRTLELALRRIVQQQTGIELGYVEQLYTFGDRGRDPHQRLISVAYLALVRQDRLHAGEGARWRDGYELFPWEDRRQGAPPLLDQTVSPRLEAWAKGDPAREQRARITFGLGGVPWDGNRVLERYELLYEIGLVAERDRDDGADGKTDDAPAARLGRPLALDHRRMVATALGRLRGKLSYRPVVFELLPQTFTLSQLQRVVQALAGRELHTPNFRRLIDRGRLVVGTGEMTRTGGRPAELFRFRREVLGERPRPGVGLPGGR